jgi:hypothetical protein
MVLARDDGTWITTGQAQGWPRCTRCRQPHETSPEGSGKCPICFFYGQSDFWAWDQHPLFPYNIGRRVRSAQIVANRPRSARSEALPDGVHEA